MRSVITIEDAVAIGVASVRAAVLDGVAHAVVVAVVVVEDRAGRLGPPERRTRGVAQYNLECLVRFDEQVADYRLRLFDPLLATTRSGLPSLLKSPTSRPPGDEISPAG